MLSRESGEVPISTPCHSRYCGWRLTSILACSFLTLQPYRHNVQDNPFKNSPYCDARVPALTTRMRSSSPVTLNLAVNKSQAGALREYYREYLRCELAFYVFLSQVNAIF